jgi:hypothetical protein
MARGKATTQLQSSEAPRASFVVSFQETTVLLKSTRRANRRNSRRFFSGSTKVLEIARIR